MYFANHNLGKMVLPELNKISNLCRSESANEDKFAFEFLDVIFTHIQIEGM